MTKRTPEERLADIQHGIEGQRQGKSLQELLREVGAPAVACHACGAPPERQCQRRPDDGRPWCELCGAYGEN